LADVHGYFWQGTDARRIYTLRKLKMRLKAPFETSFGAAHVRPVLPVELRSDGVTGWADLTATESPFYNSESSEYLAPLVPRQSIRQGYLAEDIIGPAVHVTPQGTIRVPQSPGLGYHVRLELIKRWTVEKETFPAS